ncbi:PQQ-dependent sugar dehydrogenase [Erwinia sp. 198]|uniref:PQQ-dependent sugar dehydrogenase n=1 Tax=Erwinia sp. 198 TaxID=2022746 RepID=UPI000F660438|nr:PQQ-dependent sugar dehydrogenase [Erwinia sp. 198]RRZ92893.1 PQQ-dependent sugar dehydrogenase [Erwinia sp. 198]
MSRLLQTCLLSVSLLTTGMAVGEEVTVTELQKGLHHPWGIAFLPEEQGLLITERDGQLRLWQQGKGLSAPLTGVPQVWAKRQGGLLDIALAPDFAQSRRVWLSYTEADKEGRAGAVVGYGRLNKARSGLESFRVVLRQAPKLSGGANLGSRLLFDDKGYLYISFGDNFQAATAQDLKTLTGKIVRLKADGSVPEDNPFVQQKDARPEIWTYGMRNPQGLALNPTTREVWENEHGPRGGDEINLLRKGENYGWPLATWGIDYGGDKVPGSQGGEAPNTVQPQLYWKVSPALSGMAFYQGDRFPAWKNSLFIGALKDKSLIHLTVDGEKVTEQARLLKDRGERIRDVRTGPDGYLYVLTDETDGKLLRIAPK